MKTRIDQKNMADLTFIIPIRVDTEDRIHNCSTVLRFLEKNFPLSEVLLIEQADVSCTDDLASHFANVKKFFDHNTGRFSRSNAMNLGISLATRPYICMYDSDILIHPMAIYRSVMILKSRITRIVIPFNMIFADVSGKLKEEISKNLDVGRFGRISSLAAIPDNADLKIRILNGGILLADRNVIALEGGFNKKMISYGWEDTEFFKRFDKLGYYSFMLSEFSLVHLDHRRGPDSKINEMYDINRQEFEKVIAMNRKQLRKYVETDIDIALSEERIGRPALRKRQAMSNILFVQKLTHLANKIRIHVQVYGLGNFLSKLIHEK